MIHFVFDEDGNPVSAEPRIFSILIPFIYDSMPLSVTSRLVAEILSDAAAQSETLAVMPLENIIRYKLNVESLVPLIKIGEENQLASLPFTPKMIEINFEYSPFPNPQSQITNLQASFPDTILALRLPFIDGQTLLGYAESGIRVFHLVADFHGRGSDGRFVFDLIRDAHLAFVKAGIRDEVTLIGSGGIVAAEHVPKAIIAGLDLVALDTPLLVAMQAQFDGECADRQTSQFSLPKGFVHSDDFNHRKTASNLITSREYQWGLQRLKNMTAAWRDQLLEILGAMGLREVRRLRGEMGRAMFQADLEHEAFAEIEGYK